MTDETNTPKEKPEEKTEDKPEEKPEDKTKDEPEATSSPLLDETKKTIEELNRATSEMKKERAKMEKVSSDLALQGKGLMGHQAPVKLSDTEIADKLERGEINPLKEDGYLN